MAKRMLTEEQALQKLGVSSFREVKKEQIVQLCSMLPQMDPNVAQMVLEQFPRYAESMGECVRVYKDVAVKVLESGQEGSKAFYDAANKVLDEIGEELKKPLLLPGTRAKLNGQMLEVIKMMREKDAEDKNFLLKVLGGVGGVVLGVLGITAAILGVRSNNGPKQGEKPKYNQSKKRLGG